MEMLLENVLKARLATAPVGVPFVWPNQDSPANAPLVAVDIVRVSRTDETLTGARPVSRGRLVCVVVVEQGTSTSGANTIAEAISAHFQMGMRLTFADGAETRVVTITRPPLIREGFRDANHWHVPVIVDYSAN